MDNSPIPSDRRRPSLASFNPTAANAHKPDAVRYSAAADQRSWKAMENLFLETLHWT
jgi:hypothetical protein